MHRGRKIVFDTIMLAVHGVVLSIGIEIVSYRTIPPVRLRIEGDPLISPDREMGFVPRPWSRTRRTELGVDGTIVAEYHLYTDRLGARVSRPGEETPDHVDVLMIGDSFTWGHGVENQETFAARVPHHLRHWRKPRDGKLRDDTIAADAAPKPGPCPQARRVLVDHRPSAAECRSVRAVPVPVLPGSFYVAWREKDRPQIVPPRGDGTTRAQLQVKAERDGLDPLTWFVHRIDVAVSRVTFQLSQKTASDTTRQDAALQFLLEKMARTVTAGGSTLLGVYIPSGQPAAPPPATLSRTVASVGFRFLDLSPAFRRHREVPGSPPLYIPNDGHPSVAGHALIAEKIAAFVIRERLIGR